MNKNTAGAWMLKLIFFGLFALLFYFEYGLTLSYGLFLTGLWFGINFFIVDQWIHIALTRFHFYKSMAEDAPARPVSQSVIFIICYIFLAIFVVTSSGSGMGNGLIFGIGIEYCLFLWPLFQQTEQKRLELFPEISPTVSTSQVKQAVIFFWTFFIGLTIFRLI